MSIARVLAGGVLAAALLVTGGLLARTRRFGRRWRTAAMSP